MLRTRPTPKTPRRRAKLAGSPSSVVAPTPEVDEKPRKKAAKKASTRKKKAESDDNES